MSHSRRTSFDESELFDELDGVPGADSTGQSDLEDGDTSSGGDDEPPSREGSRRTHNDSGPGSGVLANIREDAPLEEAPESSRRMPILRTSSSSHLRPEGGSGLAAMMRSGFVRDGPVTMGSSVPVNIRSTPMSRTDGMAQQGAQPEYPGTFIPPHQLVSDRAGDSVVGSVVGSMAKRDMLRTRTAILRVTGFVEEQQAQQQQEEDARQEQREQQQHGGGDSDPFSGGGDHHGRSLSAPSTLLGLVGVSERLADRLADGFAE
ncbi:hypothetical protein FOA52_014006 [Chlamydomonas sp. UWO 241]|nr:hypothetical protein FOA52_014006 [Chlamydomonas sp. UWO 241]